VLVAELAPGCQHPAQKILGTEQHGPYAEGLGVAAGLDLVGSDPVAEAEDDVVEGPAPRSATPTHCKRPAANAS
jgi:hypothetical protein